MLDSDFDKVICYDIRLMTGRDTDAITESL